MDLLMQVNRLDVMERGRVGEGEGRWNKVAIEQGTGQAEQGRNGAGEGWISFVVAAS